MPRSDTPKESKPTRGETDKIKTWLVARGARANDIDDMLTRKGGSRRDLSEGVNEILKR